jgi:hypothetical protein
MHLRLNHPSLPKLVKLNGRVKGLPRNLSSSKHFGCPCHTCQDANACRNDFPPMSETHSDAPDLWSWDLFDMGENVPTLDSNQYCSFFVIWKSRFGMIFMHKDQSAETTKTVLKQAFAYAGHRPAILQSDGAGEYESLDPWLTDMQIFHRYSCADEQDQNGRAEKFGDMIGKGIRAMMMQSNAPLEFWGAAALYWVEAKNHLPHSSINDKIPIQEHTGRVPDISWFRPFGCRATVFRGKDHVEHVKISARGEPGIFVGLGSAQGKKAWLVYSPDKNRIYASRNVTFNKTFFPL